MENSHDVPAPPQPDWTYALPRQALSAVILILRATLPPPLADTPAEWALRDRVAMAAVASLQPVTAAEGRLAAQFVAADAHASECLRLATERARQWEVSRRCRAQAMSMMRESRAALRLLLRLQAERRALAKDAAAAGAAEGAEHAAVSRMAEALVEAPASSEGEPRGNAAGSVPAVRQPSPGASEARKTSAETMAGFYDPAARGAACGMAAPLPPAPSHKGRQRSS